MASKFRNLIASKLRTCMNNKSSLRDLESRMRLVLGPNPQHPFRIELQQSSKSSSDYLIDKFDTDNVIPSIISLGKGKTAFDLPRNLFMQEVLKVGLSRDFHRYKESFDISLQSLSFSFPRDRFFKRTRRR